MKILVTGIAGFIGFHLTKKLISLGYNVIGIDNINDYYDVNLKYNRLTKLGLDENQIKSLFFSEIEHLKFYKADISDRKSVEKIFKLELPDAVCNLAAQAGVRYSIENPDAYIQSNIIDFRT